MDARTPESWRSKQVRQACTAECGSQDDVQALGELRIGHHSEFTEIGLEAAHSLTGRISRSPAVNQIQAPGKFRQHKLLDMPGCQLDRLELRLERLQ